MTLQAPADAAPQRYQHPLATARMTPYSRCAATPYPRQRQSQGIHGHIPMVSDGSAWPCVLGTSACTRRTTIALNDALPSRADTAVHDERRCQRGITTPTTYTDGEDRAALASDVLQSRYRRTRRAKTFAPRRATASEASRHPRHPRLSTDSPPRCPRHLPRHLAAASNHPYRQPRRR